MYKRQAEALYDAYQLDALPPALRRNSLDYYYLSIYPSLGEMRPLAEENAPPYPATVRNAYVPVSYTHLDVYKRQTQKLVIITVYRTD